MRELNYRPNEVARSLSKKSTNTIGVIVPHIRHPYFAETVSNLEHAAQKRGYKIILCNSHGKERKEREYLEMCTSNRVAGIIVFSAGVAMEEFQGYGIPIITVERFVESGTAAVECDNRQGGCLAAQHLIDCGCRNLLHLSGVKENSMPADDRSKGFVEVCEKHGISYTEISTDLDQYNRLDYREMLEQAFLEHADVDGVFASSDLIATQALQVLHGMGKRVPEDIQLVGFDDVYLSQLTIPPLTTIHQPVSEMNTLAVDLLIDASEGKTVAKRSLLPVTLVKRGTTIYE